ncbi:hypothetical protein O1611_g8156 [Lasiodiplodia mahajangana]|uniref:Uncharacterized protein n=1 Tax=Lasiodiplodia mahajangana TaxID=1108764 RepID=A0ACC2JDN0_9PEZI|nr:hypothetical protein O1611_g8156 [Lasiodiplodia mahajangana]
MERTDAEAGRQNAEQPSQAIDLSTQTHSLSPQTLSEQPPLSPKSDSCTPMKRDFESAFPELSPSPVVKRLRSNSAGFSYSGPQDGNVSNNNIAISDNADISCETAQTQPGSYQDIQSTPTTETKTAEADDPTNPNYAERLCDYSRNEISKHIAIIKQFSRGDEIDLRTTDMLVDEIMALTAVSSTMQTEIAGLRWRISFRLGGISISPAGLEPNKTPTVSPLSEPTSSTLKFIDVATSPIVGAESEDMATQTQPAAASRSINDNEIWERELELIRRPQPLLRGPCTIVNVPLRKAVSRLAPTSCGVMASASNNVKDEYNILLQSKPGSGHNNLPVINLSDTEDETEGRHTRSSQLVGGGGFTYGMDGPQFVASDEDEEEGEPRMSISYQGPRHQRQISSNDGIVGDLPDYSDYETYDDTKETSYAEHTNTSIAPTGRHYHFGVVHNPYNQQNKESEASLFVHDDVIGVSGSKNRGRSLASREYATTPHMKRAFGGDRSRSPVYRQPLREASYRKSRDYPHRYMGEDTKEESHLSALTQARHKILDFGGRRERDGSAWLRGGDSYSRKNQRYMREEQEDPSFYGYNTSEASTVNTRRGLRYQDRITDAGEIPGPEAGLRLKLDDYVHDTGINKEIVGLEQGIKHIIHKTFFSAHIIDEEQAWNCGWANDFPKLYKGFPLVENIEFGQPVAAPAYATRLDTGRDATDHGGFV